MAGIAGVNEVAGLIESFRSTVPDSVQEIAGVRVHPLLVASNNFVEAEQDVLNARARLDAAEKELAAATSEVAARLDSFTQCKEHLAELLMK